MSLGEARWKRKFLCIVFALILFIVYLQGNAFYANAEAGKLTAYTIQLDGKTSYTCKNSSTDINKGAILHAWCWSFKTISANMRKIADAGYTSIQTSPISVCPVANGGDKKFTGQWYYHYQPTDYKIGNYQLGTEKEFKAMCSKAKKYGIHIIVDVVANHCTDKKELISKNITGMEKPFHEYIDVQNWSDRREVTQGSLLKLQDNNTQDKEVQNYILRYLKRCVELGAEGFRYDAAKHVELPDDNGFGSDFWPTILKNGAKFQYGEILQDSVSREDAYAKYMSVTASKYGKSLRDMLERNQLDHNQLLNYQINVPIDKLVTWVESHDNYANDIKETDSSQGLNDQQVKLGWAVIAAREAGAPLFFSRPVGGGGNGKDLDSRFPEMTKMGDRGSSLFMDDEVMAVNKFRNAMTGEDEYLSNPDNNNQVLMIERGNRGAVIVNMGDKDYQLNNASSRLADGSYTNATDNNNTFKVKDKTITGTVPARQAVVIYDLPVVKIKNATNVFYSNTKALVFSKGKNVTKATYSINGGKTYSYVDGKTVTIGKGLKYGKVSVIELRGKDKAGNTVIRTYYITKKKPGKSQKVYFKKPSDWGSSVNAYIYDGDKVPVTENAKWPGVEMKYNASMKCYEYSFKGNMQNPRIIFKDGSSAKQVPQQGKGGYTFANKEMYSINGYVGKK